MSEITGVPKHVTESLISSAQELITTRVIAKWRDHRANIFYQAMIQEVANEFSKNYQSQQLDQILEKVFTSPQAEELIFEAYRKVCLSSSRGLGPKIIALLTAKLLIEDRIATEVEESIFTLAEEMRDIEFSEFCVFYEKENLEENLKDSSHTYSMTTESLSLKNLSRGTPTTHLNPVIMIGKWAGKLEKVGFLYGDTVADIYNETRFYDEREQPALKFHISVIFKQDANILYNYVRRAQGPNN